MKMVFKNCIVENNNEIWSEIAHFSSFLPNFSGFVLTKLNVSWVFSRKKQHIFRIRLNQSADDRSLLKKLCFRIVFYWKTLQKDWKCYWNCTTVKYNYCIMLLYEVFRSKNCIIVCVNIFVFMLLNGALVETVYRVYFEILRTLLAYFIIKDASKIS